MTLLKHDPIKHRSVYLTHRYVKKYWHSRDIEWVLNHMKILDNIMPNYVKGFGQDNNGVYILFDRLEGVSASSFEHSTEFMRKVYHYCLELNASTKPYYHGDWVLSNMLIDSMGTIRMCDWDNVGLHSEEEVSEKLYSDLISAFGDKFKEIYNDTASI